MREIKMTDYEIRFTTPDNYISEVYENFKNHPSLPGTRERLVDIACVLTEKLFENSNKKICMAAYEKIESFLESSQFDSLYSYFEPMISGPYKEEALEFMRKPDRQKGFYYEILANIKEMCSF